MNEIIYLVDEGVVRVVVVVLVAREALNVIENMISTQENLPALCWTPKTLF